MHAGIYLIVLRTRDDGRDRESGQMERTDGPDGRTDGRNGRGTDGRTDGGRTDGGPHRRHKTHKRATDFFYRYIGARP